MTAHPPSSDFATPAAPGREEIAWVDLSQVRLGMFVHPMNRQPFLLKQRREIDAIRASGVRGVFVNLARSIEPKPERAAPKPAKAAVKKPRRKAAAPPPPSTSDLSARAGQFRGAQEALASVQQPVRSLLADVRQGRGITNAAIAPIVDQIIASVAEDNAAFISLARIRARDGFGHAHAIAVSALMANLATRLGFDSAARQELALAGLLLDIGKMLVPAKSNVLRDDETMRTHVTRGHDLLRRVRNLPDVVLDVCLHHHERMDGSGYPEGLAGAGISVAARMATLCDVYDEAISPRPDKAARTPTECLAAMFASDGHFDRSMLVHFIKSVGIFPVGSLVRLASDHLAVILAQRADDLTRPTVRIFYAIDRRAFVPFYDLVLDGADDAVMSREDPNEWGLANWDTLWVRMLAS